MDWRKAEQVAKTRLYREFHQTFEKKKIIIGEIPRSFDWVSEDWRVAVMVKSCSKSFDQLSRAQLETRFQRDYLFDCMLLEKSTIGRKIFFVVGNNRLFDEFRK